VGYRYRKVGYVTCGMPSLPPIAVSVPQSGALTSFPGAYMSQQVYNNNSICMSASCCNYAISFYYIKGNGEREGDVRVVNDGIQKISRAPFTFRISTTDLTCVRKEVRRKKNGGGWKRTAAPCGAGSCTTHSRQLCHVDLLRWHRPRRPPHLRGISFPSVGCVERRARHRTRNRARKWGSSH
jgi:hypothetical protein